MNPSAKNPPLVRSADRNQTPFTPSPSYVICTYVARHLRRVTTDYRCCSSLKGFLSFFFIYSPLPVLIRSPPVSHAARRTPWVYVLHTATVAKQQAAMDAMPAERGPKQQQSRLDLSLISSRFPRHTAFTPPSKTKPIKTKPIKTKPSTRSGGFFLLLPGMTYWAGKPLSSVHTCI